MQLISEKVPRCPSNLVGLPSSVQLPSAGAPVPPENLPSWMGTGLPWGTSMCASAILYTGASDIKGLG